MSASAQNLERIVEAKAHHSATCPFPAHTVRIHPHEIRRMGWEEGDPTLGTGALRLICDRNEPSELEVADAVSDQVAVFRWAA